ncbi:MAG: amino acid ABC transporter permease [Verrucomicrobia bacterium]|nr:amino acid ABC transporter permease [Verrucomicrobiota bacterium]
MISTDLLIDSLPLLTKGALMTIQIFLIASLISLSLGSLFGALTCRPLKKRLVTPLCECITFVLRAVPLYVQLLIIYFVLPDLLCINIEAYMASVFALGICSSAYVAQIMRSGINAIPKEQWESAFVLGYSKIASVRYVIFPQLIRTILPALTGELDSLLKSTAILSSIGLLELTRMGMNIVSREMEPLTVYLAVAALYIALSGSINLFTKYLEKRLTLC